MKTNHLKVPAAETFSAWSYEQKHRFMVLVSCVDSVSKLLDGSARIADCACDAQCFRDMEGPKAILHHTLEKLWELFYEVDNGELMVPKNPELHSVCRPGKAGAR